MDANDIFASLLTPEGATIRTHCMRRCTSFGSAPRGFQELPVVLA
jgi:hypothetical protein